MRRRFLAVMVVLLVVTGICGSAMGGGRGPEDPVCTDLPKPNRGPFIWGTFTVALDAGSCSIDFPDLCQHFNVHAVLQNLREVHLYSFSAEAFDAELGTIIDLCALSSAALQEEFARVPCSLSIGQDFGLTGTPVIKQLKITKRDFCGDSQKQMLQGWILIRVVP